MTAAGNRARRRDARLDQILDQAMSMLTIEGADALTLGRLAEAMSVTPAALYRYVASKDELVVRLQERSLAGLATIVARSREAWARSDVIQGAAPALRPLIALFGWARLYVRLREDDSPHIQLISVLVGDTRPVVSDDWARRVMPRWMALLGHAAEIIADAVACEVLAPGDATERAASVFFEICM